jgi:hypothetical protein
MHATRLIAGIILMTLVACSTSPLGNDGPSTTTPPTTPTLTATPGGIKTITFTWTTAEGATEYRLDEDREGTSAFTTIAILSTDASRYDHAVFLPAHPSARYTLSACNAAGCSASAVVTIDSFLTALIGYVKATNTATDDEYGWSVALSANGNTLAVGAP